MLHHVSLSELDGQQNELPQSFLNLPLSIGSLSFELRRNGMAAGHWKTNTRIFGLNPHCCKI